MLLGVCIAPPVASPVVSYRTQSLDATDLTTYTHSSLDIGTASAGRYVIVGIWQTNSTAARTASSVTIGGVTATFLDRSQIATGATRFGTKEYWIANVPTGTTGNVVVTWSGACQRSSVDVWAVYNLKSTTLADSQADTTNLTTSTVTISIPSGGFALAFATGNSSPTYTWSSASERSDALVETVGVSASDYSNSLGESRTITATRSVASTELGFSGMFAISFGG